MKNEYFGGRFNPSRLLDSHNSTDYRIIVPHLNYIHVGILIRYILEAIHSPMMFFLGVICIDVHCYYHCRLDLDSLVFFSSLERSAIRF